MYFVLLNSSRFLIRKEFLVGYGFIRLHSVGVRHDLDSGDYG